LRHELNLSTFPTPLLYPALSSRLSFKVVSVNLHACHSHDYPSMDVQLNYRSRSYTSNEHSYPQYHDTFESHFWYHVIILMVTYSPNISCHRPLSRRARFRIVVWYRLNRIQSADLITQEYPLSSSANQRSRSSICAPPFPPTICVEKTQRNAPQAQLSHECVIKARWPAGFVFLLRCSNSLLLFRINIWIWNESFKIIKTHTLRLNYLPCDYMIKLVIGITCISAP